MARKYDILTQIQAARLPAPDIEHRFHPTRKWRWDLCWVREMVAVEIQGGTWTRGRHSRPQGYQADCQKSCEGQLLGWLVLPVTTRMIEDGSALTLIERALQLRGNCAGKLADERL